jgi:predicted TIM-barrel fold metal-dependent hydrolase
MMEKSDLGPRGFGIGRRHFVKATAGAAAASILGSRFADAQYRDDKPGCTNCRAIDVHAHWQPDVYRKTLAEITGGKFSTGGDPRNRDLKERIKYMDDHGVEVHLLTVTAPPWQSVSADDGVRLARVVNEAAMEAHDAFKGRFYAGVAMPLKDPVMALAELNRVAGKPAFRAVHVVNSMEGKDYLFDPAYAPILARAEELGYPLVFHPIEGPPNFYGGPERLAGPAGLSNSLGFPFEHATTAAKFITTGTLDKFPKLDIILSHGGGPFPYLAGRIDQGLVRRKQQLKHPFKDYIRRFHYDTITWYPEVLRALIGIVGADRVVIGTDNFALMDVEPTWLVHQIELPAADRERIIRGNAAKLFKL